MIQKSKLFFSIFLLLGIVLFSELAYLIRYKSINQTAYESKKKFVELIGLPDLALSTQTAFIRHRSLSSMFAIFQDDATLREYSPSTFTYSPILYTDKKILDEK